mmetsp:Transcript_39/g.191  ORF Transcript_39/g.191 Transcript_39/m.191 type:complete len:426 (-) Transcript_39:123-1400(-)
MPSPGDVEKGKGPSSTGGESTRSTGTVAKGHGRPSLLASMATIKVAVLLILCLQNSMFTLLRRYSQGVLKEMYSKYEVLLAGEMIKMVFSAWMIYGTFTQQLNNKQEGVSPTSGGIPISDSFQKHLMYIISKSQKMLVLAMIYGAMNILSFVSLRNIGAGMFTIFAQCKILTTATFSTLLLQRHYSATRWRALVSLSFGVLLFSEPIWNVPAAEQKTEKNSNLILGTAAVLIEVTLSGFASIYFEKVIKTDPLQLNIWERNFQLALTSFPVYLVFIIADQGGPSGSLGGGWSFLTCVVALLGAAGGLLVALSIKYGDAILKTLATTGAIILSSVLDWAFLGGPLTPVMMIAGVNVILAIFDYTFDQTPPIANKTNGSGNSNNTTNGKSNNDNSTPINRSSKEEEMQTLLNKRTSPVNTPGTPNRK